MRRAKIIRHDLIFKSPGGTSRGVLHTKPCWFMRLDENGSTGFGEVSLLPKLSYDESSDFEEILSEKVRLWESSSDELELGNFPSIRFAFETALKSLSARDPFILYPSGFTDGSGKIEINGLVWMGTKTEMKERIKEKLEAGFRCIKLKIGAINFDDELELLKAIRHEYSPQTIELRVDANGAFSPVDALEKLKRLSEFDLHSIEQPIKPKQWGEMAHLCAQTPLDIALDEELIGIQTTAEMDKMLEAVRPQAIVIKPGLVGGLEMTARWIKAAEKMDAYSWITSALESNIGLNAIAQFNSLQNSGLPQGLGTGQLFTNNPGSPLDIKGRHLVYDNTRQWELPAGL